MAIDKLLPPETPNYWDQYRAGEISHFEGLRRYFADIRASEAEVMNIIGQMEMDPNLHDSIKRLHDAGWEVIATSAGCGWYIDQYLVDANVVVVHTNPGQFEPGKGLIMEKPSDSPFLSETVGIDKDAVVRHYLDAGRTVAFAGDRFTDADTARLVPAHIRFARSDLADELTKEGLAFHPFDTWSLPASFWNPRTDMVPLTQIAIPTLVRVKENALEWTAERASELTTKHAQTA